MNPLAVRQVAYISLLPGLGRRLTRLLSSAIPTGYRDRQQLLHRNQQHERQSLSCGPTTGQRSVAQYLPVRSASTHQRVKGRKRFYKDVTIQETVRKGQDVAAAEEEESRWEVLLDGRVLKTPGRRPLQFDTPELAMAVAAEWDAQTTLKGIEPAIMPLMALASTAIDQVASDREKTICTCLKYLPTDTVCFLAPDPDPVIERRQRQLWAPLRKWTDEALGIPVATTTEIHRKPEHPPQALAHARGLLESLDEWALAAVQSVTMECKSLVIALALLFRHTTVEKAFDAARLEEEYNVERWGMIEGGHDMDRGNTTLTLTAASTLIWLRSTSLPQSSP